MSLFFTSAREQRAVDPGDWIRGLDILNGGGKTKAGEVVTTNKALKVDAMWSSVNLLASVVANFPVDVFRGAGADKTPVTPEPAFVRQPSLVVDRQDWTYQAMVSMLLRGRAVGLTVSRTPSGLPETVEWLDPDRVTIRQSSAVKPPTFWVDGTELPRQDVMYLPAFLRPGSAIGMSPVEYRAETLGISLAAQSYGAGFYGGGGHPSAIFQNKAQQRIEPDQAKTIKDRMLAAMRGKREPLVVGSDWSYTPVQVSPAEADFVSSMGYSDAQIARMYGPGLAEVLGYQTSGSSLTYSNRVDRSLDLLVYTVAPWVTKFNNLWTRSIPRPQTARLNVNSLLRMDPKTRHEMYQIDRNIGLYSIDELRGLEDQPPIPDGSGSDFTPLKSGNTGGQANGGN